MLEQRMKQFVDEVHLYPVTCEPLSAGRTDREWLDGVLSGGAKIVQLRDKLSSDGQLLEKARHFRARTREAGALFLVNDRLDIGLLADADGIHVGQDDLPPDEIRRLAPEMIIGQSCNSLEDVKTLGEQQKSGDSSVSYYNIGPIYQTGTKEGLHTFLGPEAIEQYSNHCSLPFTVMGGITLDRVDELVRAGAKRIAVVTAVSKAPDIASATREWNEIIESTKKKYFSG